MKTSTYSVDDIHCGGCEGTIRTMVGDVDGVHEVASDHRTNQVVITYDETTINDAAVREALDNTGFPAR